MPTMSFIRRIHDIHAYLYSTIVLFVPIYLSGGFPFFNFPMVHSTNASPSTITNMLESILWNIFETILSNYIQHLEQLLVGVHGLL